ncbi:hypothetical protein [Alterisphingorhabdus coralli]|uniref:Uncharacterized protein n=1 Tax=Alterisphingorhabdus coralli TaxID=3071408 RepID=A0AA97FA19_9SPHN|nr:hypothetical protein [Parasphingorhabdus sp. SCSIO 66989]WOE75923.1 hypothetical protein RB602_04195 [Parasphingorhabdus sp. SCSIO 66989]
MNWHDATALQTPNQTHGLITAVNVRLGEDFACDAEQCDRK